MAHFALICPQHFSHSLSFCIITGIFSFLHTYIYFLICIFCRPTGFVSHTKHKLTLFLFLLFCCFFFFCFCFCYCCYYYCAESQPIIGALIVYMYVLCCMCVCVLLLLFLSACEAPARQSHASISMRIPYATNVVCRMSLLESRIVFCCCCELYKCIYSWSDKTDALFPQAHTNTFSATIFH